MHTDMSTLSEFELHQETTACHLCRGPLEASFVTKERISTVTKERISIAGFTYSYCRACDYYFVNPCPTEHSLELYYNYIGGETEDSRVGSAEGLQQTFTMYLKKGRPYEWANYVSGRLPQLSDGFRFLDFGCGSGLLLAHNRKRCEPYGVEFSSVARNFWNEKGITVVPSLQDLPDIDFDLITAMDVIEHVPDPKAALEALKSRLSPAGHIFLRMPVTEGLGFSRRHPERWKWAYCPSHTSLFSINALRRLASEVGLRCEVQRDDSIRTSFPRVIERWDLYSSPAHALIRKPLRVLFPYVEGLVNRFTGPDSIFADLTAI